MIHRNTYGSYGTADSNSSSPAASVKHARTKSYNALGGSAPGGYQSAAASSVSTYQNGAIHASSTNNLYGNSNSRMGTLNTTNNYYDKAKQYRNASEGNYVWKAIQDMIDYLKGFVEKSQVSYRAGSSSSNLHGNGSFDEPDLFLKPEIQERLDEFKQFVSMEYNTDSESHETRLMDLWRHCMGPNVELDDRVSEQWKDLGFQGRDPKTDFRAAGVFALQNLLYFAECYPKKFKKMFHKTKQDKNAYPFAIAAINVTMLLLQILGVYKLKSSPDLQARKAFIDMLFESELPFRTVEDDIKEVHGSDALKKSPAANKKPQKELVLLSLEDGQEEEFIDFNAPPKEEEKKSSSKRKRRLHKRYNCIFEELFVTAMVKLDSCWWDASASYFQFPQVLKSTRRKIERLLNREFTDIRDLRSYNKRLCSSSRRR